MGREMVREDVNRSSPGLTGDDVAEEVDKGGAGVPRHRLAEHLARLGIQRGEERQGAVSEVLEAMSFGATGRQRQHGIEPLERLNRGFLVDGEDRRMVRRIAADELGISDETVKTHMKSILARLAASDRTHAVTIATKRGILGR